MGKPSWISLAALILTTLTAPSFAMDGDLDPAFGTGGIAAEVLVSEFEMINDLALMPDGRVMVLGQAGDALALARYLANGDLDVAFGGGIRIIGDAMAGAGISSFSPDFGYRPRPRMALQADGGIVVVFNGMSPATPQASQLDDAVVARFNPDGSVDASFGEGGYVSLQALFGTSFNDPDVVVAQVTVLNDGRILIGGQQSGFEEDLAFLLVRLLSDGTLDSTFGDGGVAGAQPDDLIGTNLVSVVAHAMTVQGDGRIILAGGDDYVLSPFVGGEVVVMRFNADGSVDATFGASGVAFSSLSSSLATALAVAQQADGKIVLAGLAQDGGERRAALLRFNADGTLDPGFDGGTVITDLGAGGEWREIIAQGDGSLLAIGTTEFLSGEEDFAIARFTSAGLLDTGFGNGGIATADFFGRRDQAVAGLLLAGGDILVGGLTTSPDEGRDFGLARFDVAGTLVPSFGVGGLVRTIADVAPLALTDLQVLDDGRIVGLGERGLTVYVVRLTDDGAIDAGFGFDGRTAVTFDDLLGQAGTDVGEPLAFAAPRLVVRSDGSIVVAGDSHAPFYPTHRFFAALTSAGLPDPAFGDGGQVVSTENFGAFTFTGEGMAGAAAQSDGSIVYDFVVRFGSDSFGSSFVSRLPADGVSGEAFCGFGAPVELEDYVVLATDPLDRILVAASHVETGSALLRRNANGSPDLCFGQVGRVDTPVSVAHAAVDETGRILVAGTGPAPDFPAAVARFLDDGSADASFGTNGTATIGTDFRLGALSVLADGSVVLGGSDSFSDVSQSALVRLASDGSLDTGFGNGGQATFDFDVGGFERIHSQGIQPGGRIVADGELTSGHVGGMGPAIPVPPSLGAPGALAIVADAPDTVVIGAPVTIRLTVSNDAATTAVGLTAATLFTQRDESFDQVPPTLSIDAVSTTSGSCTISAATVQCLLDDLAPGASTSIDVTVSPDAPGSIEHYSQVQSCSQVETDFSDNKVEDRIDLEAPTVTFLKRPFFPFGRFGVIEGDDGMTQIQFPVRLTGPVDGTVTVDYFTDDDDTRTDATPGVDYISTSGTLVFAPGELVKTFSVTVLGDSIDEGLEELIVRLTNANGVELAFDEPAFAAIDDDDSARLEISKSAPPAVAPGGELTYELSFSAGTASWSNVIITDPLPIGATFVSASDGGTLANGEVSFDIGDLGPADGTRTVTFTVLAPALPFAFLVNEDHEISDQAGESEVGRDVVSITIPIPDLLFSDSFEE